MSAPQTAAYFAERNRITAEPTVRMLPPLVGVRPEIELMQYRQSGHREVRLDTIEGGGHVIPAPHRGVSVMGRNTRELVATEAIAEFFRLAPADG